MEEKPEERLIEEAMEVHESEKDPQELPDFLQKQVDEAIIKSARKLTEDEKDSLLPETVEEFMKLNPTPSIVRELQKKRGRPKGWRKENSSVTINPPTPVVRELVRVKYKDNWDLFWIGFGAGAIVSPFLLTLIILLIDMLFLP